MKGSELLARIPSELGLTVNHRIKKDFHIHPCGVKEIQDKAVTRKTDEQA